MPTVDYLPISTGAGANVDSQADFNGSGYQTVGFQAGLAQSKQVNKCIRQSSMFTAAWANVIRVVLNISVLDDGNLGALLANILAALSSLIAAGIALVSNWCGTSGGSANAQTLSPVIVATSYVTGAEFRFTAGFTNTGPVTLNVSGLGPIPIHRETISGPVALTGYEIVVGNVIEVIYDGAAFQLTSPSGVGTHPTVLKRGSNAGDYATSSGSLVDVDPSNLGYTVVIPVGSQLVIHVSGVAQILTAGGGVTQLLALADGGTPIVQSWVTVGTTPDNIPFSFDYAILGDGASHTITLQFAQGAGGPAGITNSSQRFPTMLFKLE